MRFADDLIELYDGFPQRGHVTFKPTYSNVMLDLQIGTTGAVVGRCLVRDDLVDGDSLECEFVLEQSRLPRLASDIRAFVRAAATNT